MEIPEPDQLESQLEAHEQRLMQRRAYEMSAQEISDQEQRNANAQADYLLQHLDD